MIKKKLPILIITSLITLIPIIIGLVIWDKLPDPMPLHWNANGEVDGYGSKATAVFTMPLLLLAIHWLCSIATSIDPKSKNINDKTMNLVLWITPVLSLVCNSIVYTTALGHKVDINIIMPLIVGVGLIVIGNNLPKCKQSYTVGIKLPWTLNDEENWNKTHRMAGFLWVIGGIVIIVTSFLDLFVVSFTIVILMVIVPFVYSYALYKKKNNNS